MKNNQLLLLIAGILIVVGVTKLEFNNLLPNKPAMIDVLELTEPSEESVLKEAKDVRDLVKKEVSKQDARKLRDLYIDLGQLVKLDGEDEVIKNTEEIRQANSIAGLMSKMDMKDKYANLAKECKEVVVAAIGDDQIILSPELRVKATEGFDALAWALNEGSK